MGRITDVLSKMIEKITIPYREKKRYAAFKKEIMCLRDCEDDFILFKYINLKKKHEKLNTGIWALIFAALIACISGMVKEVLRIIQGLVGIWVSLSVEEQYMQQCSVTCVTLLYAMMIGFLLRITVNIMRHKSEVYGELVLLEEMKRSRI